MSGTFSPGKGSCQEEELLVFVLIFPFAMCGTVLFVGSIIDRCSFPMLYLIGNHYVLKQLVSMSFEGHIMKPESQSDLCKNQRTRAIIFNKSFEMKFPTYLKQHHQVHENS